MKTRTLHMRDGSTPLSLYKECQELFGCWCWNDEELKKVKSDRTCDNDYEISFADNVEADEELKHLSTNDLKEKGINGITLEERLQMELDYFKETGNHLDIYNITLCTGSRFDDGVVPYVGWSGDDGMSVDWCSADVADGSLSSRVVSKPSNSITLNLSTIEIDGVKYSLTKI